MSTFQLLFKQLAELDPFYIINDENGYKCIRNKYGKYYFSDLTEYELQSAVITLRANQLIMNGYSLEQIMDMRREHEKN